MVKAQVYVHGTNVTRGLPLDGVSLGYNLKELVFGVGKRMLVHSCDLKNTRVRVISGVDVPALMSGVGAVLVACAGALASALLPFSFVPFPPRVDHDPFSLGMLQPRVGRTQDGMGEEGAHASDTSFWTFQTTGHNTTR